MSQQIFNFLNDGSHNNLRKKNQTNSNLNLNNNNKNIHKAKNLKEYLNKKINHNENVSMNIRNNLNHLSRNSNFRSIIPSFSQINDKLITSYHSKNSITNKLTKKNRPFSNILKKNKIKSKSKEK